MLDKGLCQQLIIHLIVKKEETLKSLNSDTQVQVDTLLIILQYIATVIVDHFLTRFF